MNAWRQAGRADLLSALVTRAQAWLLEPPDAAAGYGGAPAPVGPRAGREPLEAPPEPARPVVVVLGLARRAGASTLARAVAARLARLDPGGAAALWTDDERPRAGFSTTGARRLAGEVVGLGCEGCRPVGRLCLVPGAEPLALVAAERPAPLVVDAGHGAPAEAALALADHVVAVASPEVEPALVTTVGRSLADGDHAVSLVVNRAHAPPDAGALEDALVVAEASLAARLTVGCREPRGAFAEPVVELADRCLAGARP